AQLNVIHREALLNRRCLDSANRVGCNNVVPNAEGSTCQFPRRDVEVEIGGQQHCASCQGILSAVVVRRWYDNRVGSLQRPDLGSVIVSGDVRLQSCFCATARSLHLGKIEVKQNNRRTCYRGGVYHPSASNDHVATDCDSAVWIGHG